jgi:hypothetical protein
MREDREESRERGKKWDKMIEEMREERIIYKQKFDAAIKKMTEESIADKEKFDAAIEKMSEESIAAKQQFDAMHKEIGGISNSNGKIAESYFVNSFTNSMYFAGQEYDAIDHNLKRKIKKLKLQSEYDLVMYNCTSIVIIEIKYKADADDVAGLLKKVLYFKQLYPQYVNYDLYLGLAAFHFEENTEKESIDQGIAVIKQVGDSMVINDEHLKVFA